MVCDKVVSKMVCDKVVCERWFVRCDGGGEEAEEEEEVPAAEVAGVAGYRIKNKNPTQRCGEQLS